MLTSSPGETEERLEVWFSAGLLRGGRECVGDIGVLAEIEAGLSVWFDEHADSEMITMLINVR